MSFIYSLWNDSVYNFISVLSDPIILVPIVSCVLFVFIHYLFVRLVTR